MSRSFSLSVILVVTSLVIVRFPARLTAQSDVPLAVQIELLHEGLELINRHNASLGAAIGCDSAAFINLLNDLDASGSTPLFSKTSVLENDFAVTLSSGMGEVQDVTAFYSTYRDHFELAPGYDEPYRFGLMRVRPFAEQEHSGGQIYEGRIYFRTSYHHGTSRDIDEQTLAFDLVGKPGGLRLAQVSVKGDLADLSGNELLTSEVFQNYLGKRDLLVSKRSDEAALKSWLKQKSDQSVAYFISTINASIAKSKALYEIDLEQAQTLLSKAEQLSNTLIRTSQPAAYREMREQIDALNYAINAEERRRRDALLSERDRLLDDANRYLGQGELSAALEKAQAANALQATSESSALENQLKQEYGDLSGLTSLLKKEAQGKTTALRDSIESHEANLTLKHHLIGFWEFHRASELPMGEVQTRHFMQALEHCNECIAQDAGYLPCYGVRVGVMKQLISFRLPIEQVTYRAICNDYNKLANTSANRFLYSREGADYFNQKSLNDEAIEVLYAVWSGVGSDDASATGAQADEITHVGHELAQAYFDQNWFNYAKRILDELRAIVPEAAEERGYWALYLKSLLRGNFSDEFTQSMREFKGFFDTSVINSVINELKVYFIDAGDRSYDAFFLTEALAFYSAVPHIDPLHLDGWQNLGKAAYAMNNLALADSAYRRALALEPEAKATHLALAHVQCDLGQRPENLTRIESYASSSNAGIDEHIVVIRAYSNDERYKDASTHMRMVKRDFKKNAPVDYLYAEYHYVAGSKKSKNSSSKVGMLKALTKWAKAKNDGEAYFLLAAAHLGHHPYYEQDFYVSKSQNSEYVKALKHYKRSMTLGFNPWMVSKYMGRAAFSAGKHKKAVESFDAALAHNPKDLESRIYLGLTYFYTNKSSAAASVFNDCKKFGLVRFTEQSHPRFKGTYGIAALNALTTDFILVKDANLRNLEWANDWNALMESLPGSTQSLPNNLYSYTSYSLVFNDEAKDKLEQVRMTLREPNGLLDIRRFEETIVFKELRQKSPGFKKFWSKQTKKL